MLKYIGNLPEKEAEEFFEKFLGALFCKCGQKLNKRKPCINMCNKCMEAE